MKENPPVLAPGFSFVKEIVRDWTIVSLHCQQMMYGQSLGIEGIWEWL